MELEVAGRVEGDDLPARRSAWIRSAICWAIVPLGMNAAAGLPSSSRTSCSSAPTARRAVVVGVQVRGGQRRDLGERDGGRRQPLVLERTVASARSAWRSASEIESAGSASVVAIA